MTYEEILLDVNVMVQNSIADQIKLRWINQIERQLYRELPLDESIYPFSTVEEQQIYDVPDDCSLDCITSVVIGGREYEQVSPDDERTSGCFWVINAGLFTINPKPSEVQAAIVTYKPTPLLPDDVKKESSLPVDFHQLLVDGCAARVARAHGDMSKATMFDNNYTTLLRQAKRSLSINKVLPDIRVI